MAQFKVLVCIPVKERELAEEVIKNLTIPTNIFIRNDSSFSKMINNLIYAAALAENQVIIICSHRVRPVDKDITRLIEKIKEGYGLVAFRRLAFFGFHLDLIRRIGFFDERFIPAGYEDDDFFFRLQEHNIALYEDNTVEYIPGPSLWQQELIEYPETQFKQPITYKFFNQKWERNVNTRIIARKLPEIDTCYNIGTKRSSLIFKPWKDSVLLPENVQRHYNIMSSIRIIKKKIIIIGGTGSLGCELVKRFNGENEIYIMSRDENKHWILSQKESFKGVEFLIGDIRDFDRVKQILIQVNPHIIIIAAALKHIDRCEFEVNEAIQTNTIGVLNVCKAIQLYECFLKRLSTILFISTDKAVNPINTYGMTKGLAEKTIREYSKKLKTSPFKFVIIRYGNILNSRGSIIPKLNECKESILSLTHPDMTRFIMTQEEAMHLSEYAIIKGKSGETIIPKLTAMKIKDVFELFCERDLKTMKIEGMRTGEKIYEELLSTYEIPQVYIQDNYYIIGGFSKDENIQNTFTSYTSNDHVIEKDVLKEYLQKLQLI
jgi:hypothetical protein